MIIVMNANANRVQVEAVVKRLQAAGLSSHVSVGSERTVIGVIGKRELLDLVVVDDLPGVERAVRVSHPFKLVSRECKKEDTVVEVGGIQIGGDKLTVMAGPCAVENRDQILQTARFVRDAGATVLRGGAFKPRTSPYAFAGLEEEGLRLLNEAGTETGLKIITEVMDTRSVELVSQYADILQVGARNMQNFTLLRELSKLNKPVLLKRGPSSTVEEWLMAAEYIMAGGNHSVILCERGIRTFETYTRNTLDLSAIPVVKHLSHLPVIVDPSHGTGKWRWVSPMARAAVAAGADGLLIEVHPNPNEALSDGFQSLNFENFKQLMDDLRLISPCFGRSL